MSKYIILYRHGLAEEKSNVEDDMLRSLSVRGKSVLKKSVSGFKTMLGRHRHVIIYTSPKQRSIQTAEMLAEELHTGQPVTLDFLAAGGNIKLLKGLLEDAKTDTIAILVGHQPYLSVWSQEISGFYLPFKKGTAACYKYPDEITEEKAELRWYLQSRDFIKIKDK
ncbi:MAG: histidine phosphatase family protein [Tissierellia bacterium]|nr:histidine phosphatase family protein [Tissierellia bacterium]MDD4726215.1 histidine phosphatase family protein [Tissierellia bacterium]